MEWLICGVLSCIVSCISSLEMCQTDAQTSIMDGLNNRNRWQLDYAQTAQASIKAPDLKVIWDSTLLDRSRNVVYSLAWRHKSFRRVS